MESLFLDREQAGWLLAQKLSSYKGKNTLVLGIPRGGVPVAKVISNKLGAKLDIVITKKIGAPGQKELAIGAVGPGERVLYRKLIKRLGVEEKYIEEETKAKQWEIKEKEARFRKGRKKLEVRGKTVILVDDGIATGATAGVAVKHLKAKGARKIILAVPVAPKETIERFKKLVDELVVLEVPFNFAAVGQFYQSFPQITDEEVIQLLK